MLENEYAEDVTDNADHKLPSYGKGNVPLDMVIKVLHGANFISSVSAASKTTITAVMAM